MPISRYDIDSLTKLYKAGNSKPRKNWLVSPEKNENVMCQVVDCDPFNFKLIVKVLYTNRIISNVRYSLSGSQRSLSGSHPLRGTFVNISPLTSGKTFYSEWVVNFTLPFDYLSGYRNLLSLGMYPGYWNYPFHPYHLLGDTFSTSDSLSESVQGVLNYLSTRDGQQVLLDPVSHQMIINSVQSVLHASGVINLKGPVFRNMTDDFPILTDGSVVEYLNKGYDGGNGLDMSWQKATDFSSLNNFSSLTEDSSVLFEYNNRLPLLSLDKEEFANSDPIEEKPYLLYGKGTFIPSHSSIGDGSLEYGKIYKPKIYSASTDTAPDKSYEDITSKDKEGDDYDPLVSWTILPAEAKADDVYVGLHKSGKMSVALGLDKDKRSLDLDAPGVIKLTVGKDDDSNSLLLDLKGKAVVSTEDDIDVTTTANANVVAEGEINLEAGGTGGTTIKMDSSEINMNGGKFVSRPS